MAGERDGVVNGTDQVVEARGLLPGETGVVIRTGSSDPNIRILVGSDRRRARVTLEGISALDRVPFSVDIEALGEAIRILKGEEPAE